MMLRARGSHSGAGFVIATHQSHTRHAVEAEDARMSGADGHHEQDRRHREVKLTLV